MREEENFAVKTRVHDEMGELLGLTRNLIAQEHISLAERKSVAKRWGQVSSTLGASSEGDEETFDVDKTLIELTKVIAAIGVTLHIKGEFPQKSSAANLLIAAIRECAVNTVRHAEGSEMTVELTRTDVALTAVITNNGNIPEGEIQEGGGLSSLRRKTENAGGIMRVESAPVFKLEMILPGKEGAE